MNANVCKECGTVAQERTCAWCGASAIVIDCGHVDQPVEIAASAVDGAPVCASCGEGETEARRLQCALDESVGDDSFRDAASWDGRCVEVRLAPGTMRITAELAARLASWLTETDEHVSSEEVFELIEDEIRSERDRSGR